jgi:hypothetical protein
MKNILTSEHLMSVVNSFILENYQIDAHIPNRNCVIRDYILL